MKDQYDFSGGERGKYVRQAFKDLVFHRDYNKCVNCGLPGVDAHHIMERRLFPDGGYYIDNGVTVCSTCHQAAEATLIGCDVLRQKAGIHNVVLPPHLATDTDYDKWGNPILPSGYRLRGELFDDEAVQKVLRPVLHMFINRVKYPRTYHFLWSPGLQNDDRQLPSTEGWQGRQVVITEKMDGEGTTFYHDGLHARSVDDMEPHPSRTFIKAIHAACKFDIPDNYRVCGENLTAVHSIKYTDLPSYFMVFSIWNGLTCLSWEETMEWSALLGLRTVPVLYWGEYSDDVCKAMCDLLNPTTQEGLVVRPAARFHYRDFPKVVGKYVRKSHVQTDEHWMRKEVEFNGLAKS